MGKLRDYVISLLGDDYLQATKNNFRDELRYQCPFCEEEGRHNDDYKLYINTIDGQSSSGKYQCKRCGATGTIKFDEYRKQSTSEGITKLLEDIYRDYHGDDDLIEDWVSDEDEDDDYYVIPKNYPKKGTLAYDYILSRGITEEDIEFYNIRVPNLDSPKNMQGRFIVPNRVISKVWTDMYVARSYVGSKVRYKNPVSSAKSKIIFNYQNIEKGIENLIVNEGALNSIIAGRNSIALYGKVASDSQISMIVDKNPKNIYISLDTDAKPEAIELCSKLVGKVSDDTKVYLVDLPNGLDASDLGKSDYLDIVYNSKEFVNKDLYNIFSSIG